MLKVGLTGGIGSGKTLVSRIFHETYNIPVFYADSEAKKLMQENPSLKNKIINLLGTQAYQPDSTLNKKFIAKKIFSSSSTLEQLNKLVHKEVQNHFSQWLPNQQAPYILHEAAILIESGVYKNMNAIINITSPLQLRIKRIIERDKMSKEQILQRIDKQLSDNERQKYSDYKIINNNTISLMAQIKATHQKLLTHE